MHKFNHLVLILGCICLCLTGLLLISVSSFINEPPEKQPMSATTPDFASFTNAKKKKQAFFGYLLPMIEASNKAILNDRKRLQAIAEKLEANDFGEPDARLLADLSKRYDIDNDLLGIHERIEQLMLRVDQVPASLALAQAAKESGWGTSRFARDANNYFGQWCYVEGCGLVPQRRSEGATHEVKKFETTHNSVSAYLKNINTHNAYTGFRDMRASLRQQDAISGLKLAEQLGHYSERGNSYVKEIQAMIRFNNLDQLDNESVN